MWRASYYPLLVTNCTNFSKRMRLRPAISTSTTPSPCLGAHSACGKNSILRLLELLQSRWPLGGRAQIPQETLKRLCRCESSRHLQLLQDHHHTQEGALDTPVPRGILCHPWVRSRCTGRLKWSKKYLIASAATNPKRE
jgi:hypothetical protein